MGGLKQAPATAWRDLLTQVPRSAFIPEVAVIGPVMDDPASWIDQRRDPEGWWRAVHSDIAIATQLDDGTTDLKNKTAVDPAAVATSSCSAPHLVAAMLDLLDAQPGNRVLEIGTGTGWTAGLLAHRVGDACVISIEIDPRVADQAIANLRAAGRGGVRVLVGDGELGWATGAPYDRVHVTAGAARVPYAWVEQTRPGGVVVLPWMPGWESGYLVRLTVADDGTASGRLGERCGFMPLRQQRTPPQPIEGEERTSHTTVVPRELATAGEGFAAAVAGLMPGVHGGGFDNADGSFRMTLRHGDSHALAIHHPGAENAMVEQTGPRNLWDELVTAYRRWTDWGRPSKDRFGLRVTNQGVQVWLDGPDTPVEEL